MLKSLPLMTSMGGMSLWMARAITDLAVPRDPEITTDLTCFLSPDALMQEFGAKGGSGLVQALREEKKKTGKEKEEYRKRRGEGGSNRILVKR